MPLIPRNVTIYGNVMHHSYNNTNTAGQIIILIGWNLFSCSENWITHASHDEVTKLKNEWYNLFSPYIRIKGVAIQFRTRDWNSLVLSHDDERLKLGTFPGSDLAQAFAPKILVLVLIFTFFSLLYTYHGLLFNFHFTIWQYTSRVTSETTAILVQRLWGLFLGW